MWQYLFLIQAVLPQTLCQMFCLGYWQKMELKYLTLVKDNWLREEFKARCYFFVISSLYSFSPQIIRVNIEKSEAILTFLAPQTFPFKWRKLALKAVSPLFKPYTIEWSWNGQKQVVTILKSTAVLKTNQTQYICKSSTGNEVVQFCEEF